MLATLAALALAAGPALPPPSPPPLPGDAPVVRPVAPVDPPPIARPAVEPWPGAYSGQELEYRGGPIPAGARVVEHNHTLAVSAAGVVFATTYGLSLLYGILGGVITAAFGEDASLFWLVLPVFGPIIAVESGIGGKHSLDAHSRPVFYVDALVQTLALGGFGWAVLTRWRGLVYDPTDGARSGLQLRLLPGAPGAPLGASVQLLHF